MADVQQYVGARYVPLFATPLQWDINTEYEPLTIVLYQGSSYTSRQAVPQGIDITNDQYWALTGNYNAQVEQYRQEVRRFDGRITANETNITALQTGLEDANKEIQEVSENAAKRLFMPNEKGKNALFIGDSFFYPTSAYPQKIPDYMCESTGWNKFNASYGGAGWCDPAGANKTFSDQLTAALSIVPSAAEVDYIIIMGGFNDWNNSDPVYTYTDMYNAANATLIKARTLYPNAKIFVAPMNFRNYGLDNHFWDLYQALVAGLRGTNVAYNLIDNVFMYQLGVKNVDGVHPEPAMYRVYSENLLSAIFGGNVNTHRVYITNVNSAHYTGFIQFDVTPSGVLVSPSIRTTTAVPANTTETLCSMPNIVVPPRTNRTVLTNASGELTGILAFGQPTVAIVNTVAFTANYNVLCQNTNWPLYVVSPQ